jgi:hypothetical protein
MAEEVDKEKIERRVFDMFENALNENDNKRQFALVNEGHVYPSVWKVVQGKQVFRVISGSELAEYLTNAVRWITEIPEDFNEFGMALALIDLCQVTSKTIEYKNRIQGGEKA